jgi:hypothetical protein
MSVVAGTQSKIPFAENLARFWAKLEEVLLIRHVDERACSESMATKVSG